MRRNSKQLHTAHASSAGLAAAYLALDGLTGARRILEGPQGLAPAPLATPIQVGSLTAWDHAGD